MRFSFNTFSELLSEFQKYLSARIPKVVYYALGLVMLVLGAIVGYVLGWDNLTGAWQRADVFFKVTLAVGCALVFFIIAYLLGTLQGIVERWFQGDIHLPLWRQWGHWRHHRRWQKKNDAFKRISTIYSHVKASLDEATNWASTQPTIVLTTRPLSQYHIIAEKDLMTLTVNKAPAGSFQKRSEVVGAMIQHPLDEGVRVTDADIVPLPAALRQPVIIALTVFSDLVPAALSAGDCLTIYPETVDASTLPLKATQLIKIQESSRQGPLGREERLTHLTLAIAEQDLSRFTALPHSHRLRVVRQIATPQVPDPTSAQATPPPATTPAHIPLSIEQRKMYQEKLSRLKEQYRLGAKWLERLRTGHVEEPAILGNLKFITQVLEELEPLRLVSGTIETDRRQAGYWWSQFAEQRMRWIELLDQAQSELVYRVEQEYKAFSLYYPSAQSAVTSTAIGNVFRAVDSYGKMLYGLDTALVLPRLQVVMEKETREQLGKAHEQLALLEWLCLSSFAIGIMGSIIALYTQHYKLASLLLCQMLLIPFLLHPALVSSALDYAIALRLAYDRERGKVIAMMGITLPATIDQEREKATWQSIQEWWEYGQAPGNYEIPKQNSR